ncbi:MAG TPA: response regulator, partial [bacterium]|nr:response regulator [bacterium]
IDKIKKTVLFLLNDNDAVLVRVIKNKFKKDAGWESIISSNFNETVILFEQSKPDVVLTEIILEDEKGRTGFDFITEIKTKENIRKAQIIIFTELGQNDDKEKAKNLDVKYFFTKSEVTINELIDQIKNIVN